MILCSIYIYLNVKGVNTKNMFIFNTQSAETKNFASKLHSSLVFELRTWLSLSQLSTAGYTVGSIIGEVALSVDRLTDMVHSMYVYIYACAHNCICIYAGDFNCHLL